MPIPAAIAKLLGVVLEWQLFFWWIFAVIGTSTDWFGKDHVSIRRLKNESRNSSPVHAGTEVNIGPKRKMTSCSCMKGVGWKIGLDTPKCLFIVPGSRSLVSTNPTNLVLVRSLRKALWLNCIILGGLLSWRIKICEYYEEIIARIFECIWKKGSVIFQLADIGCHGKDPR